MEVWEYCVSAVIQGLLVRVRAVLGSLGRGLQRIARATLGEMAWRAPPWISWLADKARTGTGIATAYARRKPRLTVTIATGVIALIAGSYVGWRWYQSLPKPVETAFTITAPGLTCYSCEPPGKPQPLLVAFSDSAAPLNQTGKDVDPAAGLIRMTPVLKGTWHWDTDRALRFQPAEDWPIGARFE